MILSKGKSKNKPGRLKRYSQVYIGGNFPGLIAIHGADLQGAKGKIIGIGEGIAGKEIQVMIEIAWTDKILK